MPYADPDRRRQVHRENRRRARERRNLERYGTPIHPRFLAWVCPYCLGLAEPHRRQHGLCARCARSDYYHMIEKRRAS